MSLKQAVACDVKHCTSTTSVNGSELGWRKLRLSLTAETEIQREYDICPSTKPDHKLPEFTTTEETF